MSKHSFLLRQTKKFVSKLFESHDVTTKRYFDFERMQEIVKNVKKMSRFYDLNKEELFIARAAAWFLGVGYLQNVNDSGKIGSTCAESFFKRHDVPRELIRKIKSAVISAATLQPSTTVEMILCDAATAYMGAKRFKQYSAQRRKAEQRRTGKEIHKSEWAEMLIEAFSRHRFFTSFAEQKLNNRKAKNLKWLLAKKSTVPTPTLS